MVPGRTSRDGRSESICIYLVRRRERGRARSGSFGFLRWQAFFGGRLRPGVRCTVFFHIVAGFWAARLRGAPAFFLW